MSRQMATVCDLSPEVPEPLSLDSVESVSRVSRDETREALSLCTRVWMEAGGAPHFAFWSRLHYTTNTCTISPRGTYLVLCSMLIVHHVGGHVHVMTCACMFTCSEPDARVSWGLSL